MKEFQYYLLLLNNFKIIKQIKWFFSLFALLLIKIKRIVIKRNRITKKRLFSTTGNISLLNALTIIKQLGEKDYEDYLIIESCLGGYNFWKNNYDIAKLHNFKEIKLIYNIRFMTELRLSCWTDFDEVYALNHMTCLPPLLSMYPNAKISLFDEGCGSLVNHTKNINDIKNLKHFYTHKYIQKIDGFGLPKTIIDNCIPLDTNMFQKISNEIEKQFPIITPYNKNDKNILFCGMFWEASGLTRERFIEVQNIQLEDLIQAGYKILFKPHPRDIELYDIDKNTNITIIDSVLPIEVYHWNILAVTGMNCTSSINMPHYHNIPGFSNIVNDSIDCTKDSFAANLVRVFIKEYSPSYKELLKLDVLHTSREELKRQIKQIYDDFIKEKPLLSQNNKVKEFANKYGNC